MIFDCFDYTDIINCKFFLLVQALVVEKVSKEKRAELMKANPIGGKDHEK